MADLGISEFSFGYAFLFEQTQRNWANLTAAPVLPSLQQEADLGWDARLPLTGTDFYYQFKVAKRMVSRRARFRKDGTYETQYYQIDLHRRDFSRQHRTLWAHAQRHPNTFYVAVVARPRRPWRHHRPTRRAPEAPRRPEETRRRDDRGAAGHGG